MKKEAQSKDLKGLHATLTFSQSKSCHEPPCRPQEQPAFLTAAGFGLPSPWLFQDQCIAEARQVSLIHTSCNPCFQCFSELFFL